jgi:predicted nuclease with TOPRIM domain
MDNFEENDYGFNDFEDTYSNELNAGELVDVRIILTNLDYLEFLSKAVSNFDLSNFNVNISSIIPTKDIEIAKNTLIGADLVLIAAENNAKNHKLYQNFKKSLKNEFNYIEYLKLPSLDELNGYEYDDYDDNLMEDEIANSIIRGGLYSISNLSSINDSKRKYAELKKNFEEESLKYDKITRENDLLVKESKSLREKNEKLSEEVKILQRQLDQIKSDFSDLKSRFEGIHSKNSLEVYSLNELWYDLFGEYLSQDVYKFILISTDNFRPKNLMIGQGAICAESKEDALDWLKIIKTAFILSDTNKQDLDYNNFKSNFKFDDIDEFSSSSSLSTSGFETLEENDIFSSPKDDGFIYNERFEGNSNIENDSTDSIIDDDLFSNAFIDESKKEDINVFNLKSLKSIEDEEDDSSENPSYSSREEDYDYDDEEMKDDEEEEIYNAFSNLWG